MISNLFLKFSELEILDQESQPFSNIFGTTSAAVLTEFFLYRILWMPAKKSSYNFWQKAGIALQT